MLPVERVVDAVLDVFVLDVFVLDELVLVELVAEPSSADFVDDFEVADDTSLLSSASEELVTLSKSEVRSSLIVVFSGVTGLSVLKTAFEAPTARMAPIKINAMKIGQLILLIIFPPVSFMVFSTIHNLKSSVCLFEKHDTSQLMRKCHF